MPGARGLGAFQPLVVEFSLPRLLHLSDSPSPSADSWNREKFYGRQEARAVPSRNSRCVSMAEETHSHQGLFDSRTLWSWFPSPVLCGWHPGRYRAHSRMNSALCLLHQERLAQKAEVLTELSSWLMFWCQIFFFFLSHSSICREHFCGSPSGLALQVWGDR